MTSKISELMDSFDPPLLRLSNRHFMNSAKRGQTTTDIEQKFKEGNPNLASAGFKFHTKSSRINTMTGESNEMEEDY